MPQINAFAAPSRPGNGGHPIGVTKSLLSIRKFPYIEFRAVPQKICVAVVGENLEAVMVNIVPLADYIHNRQALASKLKGNGSFVSLEAGIGLNCYLMRPFFSSHQLIRPFTKTKGKRRNVIPALYCKFNRKCIYKKKVFIIYDKRMMA